MEYFECSGYKKVVEELEKKATGGYGGEAYNEWAREMIQKIREETQEGTNTMVPILINWHDRSLRLVDKKELENWLIASKATIYDSDTSITNLRGRIKRTTEDLKRQVSSLESELNILKRNVQMIEKELKEPKEVAL